MNNETNTVDKPKSRVSIVGIVISILSIATALNMLINPGPFGSQLPAVLSQFAAGAFLFVWSMMPARRLAWGFGAWFGGAVIGAAIGAILAFL